MTVSYVGSASATGSSGADPVVNIPAGDVGDFLIAYGIASAGATLTLPGIFTLRGEAVNVAAPIGIRVADGSEGATATFVCSGLSSSICRIVRIRGQHASTPIDFITGINNTLQTLVIPSGTAAAARYLFEMVAKLTVATWTPPGTATERYDADTSAGGDEMVAAGATGTRSWVCGAAGGNAVGYMAAIVPAPPATGSFSGSYAEDGSGFAGAAGPGRGQFAGAYLEAGSGFTGGAGPGEGQFAGSYLEAGSDFAGVAGAPTAYGFFSGGYDFSGDGFSGNAPEGGDLLPPTLNGIPPGTVSVGGNIMPVPSAGARRRRRGR